MALHDLNRAQDTPIATLKVADITPKNWHRFPTPMPDATPAFVPVKAYIGGAFGDDVSQSTATVLYTSNSPAPEDATYAPLTQAAKATALGTTIAADVTRPRGVLEPDDPYPVAATPAPTAPTITSLAPNTGVSGAGKAPTWVTVTGTGFTQWSTVKTGGVSTPYYRYVSATRIDVLMDPRSTPGTVAVVITDHGADSNASNFTFS